MEPFAMALVIGGSVIIGLVCQLIGSSRSPYEWRIGSVGAIYGELFGNTVLSSWLATGPIVLGLHVVPAVVGGFMLGGLSVFLHRQFASHVPPADQMQAKAEETSTLHVILTYTPRLLAEPILASMHRRSGVATVVGHVAISGDEGSVELDIIGSARALAAAMQFLGQSGVQMRSAAAPRPILDAAA